MTNNLRDKMVNELENREEGLEASLKLTWERLVATKKESKDPAQLDAKYYELSCELDDIDEVLRLLEAR